MKNPQKSKVIKVNSMLRRYFIAGLLVWVPIWVTLLVIDFLAGLMERSVNLLPQKYQPETLLGFHIPGLGIIFTLLLVFLTGIIATNFFGNKLVSIAERVLGRIPIVRSIYSGSKQVMQTIFKPEGEAFKKVLLVEFPHRNMWTVAFQTGTGFYEAQEKLGEELVSIFVPTTPNPTGGFLMMVPKKDTIELTMSVEEAFKMIISLGVVLPSVTELQKQDSTVPVEELAKQSLQRD